MENRSKVNQLHHIIPEGLVVDTGWLYEKGYSSALLSRYIKSGWLEQPARGVYRRPGGRLLWEQVVISLQSLLGVRVSVGGRTALELGGHSHYVSHGGVSEVHLYSDSRLPGWVGKLNLAVRFKSHNSRNLFRAEPDTGNTRDGWDPEAQRFKARPTAEGSLTQFPWGQWDWPLILSVPERAILELLFEVPDRETFHQADKFMEGLRTLGPTRMQQLLEDCRNVKVKRLFLWFAQRHGLGCLTRINQDRIDLGKGKRMLVRGGKLDPKYLITVPEDLYGRG